MELVHGFLAISAEMHDGRFSLIGGGFDGVQVPAFPAAMMSLCLIARVRVLNEEEHQAHPVNVIIYQPNGQPMMRAGPTMVDVRSQHGPRIGPFERGRITNIIINLYGIVFADGGLYRVDFLDGEQVFGMMTIPVADARMIQGG